MSGEDYLPEHFSLKQTIHYVRTAGQKNSTFLKLYIKNDFGNFSNLKI